MLICFIITFVVLPITYPMGILMQLIKKGIPFFSIQGRSGQRSVKQKIGGCFSKKKKKKKKKKKIFASSV